MQHQITSAIQPGDVIRARRFGNKTVGNYVIDKIARFQPAAEQGGFSAYAHREYGSFDEQYMTFHVETVRVIRSYRVPEYSHEPQCGHGVPLSYDDCDDCDAANRESDLGA